MVKKFKQSGKFIVTLYENFVWALIGVIALVASYFDWLGIGWILVSRFGISDVNLKASILVFCYTITLILALTFILSIWDLFVYYVLRRDKEPQLDIIPHAGIPKILNRPRYQSAELEIINPDQQVVITECYATLIELSHMRPNVKFDWVRVIPSPYGQPDRILWLESADSNAQCEIKIPAIDSRHLDLADTLESRILGFNLRSGKFAPSEGEEENSMPAYTVSIRIDWKYDGESMKPKLFNGYLYWETIKLKTIINLQQPNGEFIEEIHEQDSIPLLVFEEGDWMKSKKVRKIFGFDDEKKDVFTKEDFLKALKKVTRPLSLKFPKSLLSPKSPKSSKSSKSKSVKVKPKKSA